jgi:hypothetical protein
MPAGRAAPGGRRGHAGSPLQRFLFGNLDRFRQGVVAVQSCCEIARLWCSVVSTVHAMQAAGTATGRT